MSATQSDPSPLEQEIAAEQRHVDRVYSQLTRLRETAARSEAEGYRMAGARVPGSLVERDAMVFHAARRRLVLDTEHEGLVFGRLDLRDHEAPRYVGRIGIREEQTHAESLPDAERAEPLVIDWRAPAAEPFYRATAAHPQGVIRRRMIQSAGETVIGIEDDLLDPEAAPPGMTVIGDGALLAALSRAKGTGMRDIVATIQQEQDVAIRAPGGGITIVEGGPGTGKTAVALHRAAYLLYSDRARFAGGGVLIVGPSPVFVDYISSVLPSLGEDTATLRSLGQLVDGLKARREETPDVHALKGSLRMRQVLRRAAEDAAPSAAGLGLRIRYRGEWLELPAREAERIRRRVGKGAKRNEIRARAFTAVLDVLWAQAAPRLKTLEQSQFDEELADHEEFRTFLKRWWPRLRPIDVLRFLAEPRRLRWYAEGILSPAEQRQLIASIPDLDTEPSIDDVALLDEIDELIGRPPKTRKRAGQAFTVGGVREVTTFADRQRATRNVEPREGDYRDFAHVIVDESQDVTPMQWRMLGRRGRIASWTIVGDPAQSAWTGDATEVARARDTALGSRARHRHALTTNYRNPAEIFEVAAEEIRRIAPDQPLPRAVRSTGVAPVHLIVEPGDLEKSVLDALGDLRNEVAGTVGVIAPDQSTRDLIIGWLGAELPDRVQVVTGLQAKGMEYDGVLIVEPGVLRADSTAGVRTLYVALSRATQRLTTLATTPWR
ncbi:DNA helicase IV [Allocatelliglobosispora scoriae]|uniref:DNA helicase IV n=1 Tax=Allocatelliglobosispora scoriae TaxID=643052 RepID=A0A841BS79_9ACTN|nr:AAA family ATPase [Allocatelliglobosispora scoriae]MBB5869582.1 DNA helicase IV [Allocatelliglobosispora scoriae]